MDAKSTTTILIVDDVEANRQTLLEILDGNGFQFLEAADGMEALKLASSCPPDLVLLDIMMPGIDGYEVCRRIRANPHLAEVPVIMITALDDQASRLAGIEAGADDFITKPFNFQELRARVRTISRLNRFRRLVVAQDRIREQASLLDQARDAIIVQDLEGRITYWNKGAERVFGWSAELAQSRSFDDLLKDGSKALASARESIAQTGEWNGQLQCEREDGRKLIIESRWSLVRDSHGRPRGIMMINTDVTNAKLLEQQVFRMQRIQSIGALAGGIAHDLNNVLAPILMSIELLRMTYSDPDGEKILATLESSARRGTDLVKQVLTFLRGVHEQKTPLQVEKIVREIAGLIRETFPKTIQFEVITEEQPWSVSADATQFHQVLMNLCVNARDAMPSGGRLTITVQNTLIDASYASANTKARLGAYVVVSVADTGSGIPASIQSKIFEPFFSTKSSDKGTGLGLATVSSIIENHGGFLVLNSEEGRGTEFKVYLPAAETGKAQENSQTAKHLPGGNGELILVVDDESAVRGMAKQILEAFGYKVITASDGSQAIAICDQQNEIRVLLTDLMMPILDGPAVIRAVRQIAPHMRIIAETGFKSDAAIPDEMRMEVSAYLQKPFTAENLLTTVREVLSGGPIAAR
jgi:PAS domain S-box-containing protein